MDNTEIIRIISAALCLLTVFEFSLGVDTLYPNQTLANGEVLTSPSQVFEVGFFSRGTSSSRFLGIWYKATPEVIVWVANRNNPIIGSQGFLTLVENGTLVLSTAQRANIWTSKSTRVASSPALQLLDTGNLVLADAATDSEGGYVWQSFDHPTDTSLPGMKVAQNPDTGETTYLTSWKSADDPSSGEFSYRIENQGLSQTVITKGAKKIYRVVFWNGYFNGFFSNNPYWRTELNDPSWRVEVQTNRGRLISYFNPFYESINTRLTINYSGLYQRYMMNDQRDGWTVMLSMPSDPCDEYGKCGFNGICKLSKTPICECLRGFNPKSDSLSFRLNTSMSISECHDECLKNCNCTAYADPFFSNGSSCLMWFGGLIDIREQDGNSHPPPSIYLRVPLFDLGTIAAATNNFSRENLIGEGGFGPVYKGNLAEALRYYYGDCKRSPLPPS